MYCSINTSIVGLDDSVDFLLHLHCYNCITTTFIIIISCVPLNGTLISITLCQPSQSWALLQLVCSPNVIGKGPPQLFGSMHALVFLDIFQFLGSQKRQGVFYYNLAFRNLHLLFTEQEKVTTQQNTMEHQSPDTSSADDRLLLSSWGLPETILDNYQAHGITRMFEWQAECLCTGNALGRLGLSI